MSQKHVFWLGVLTGIVAVLALIVVARSTSTPAYAQNSSVDSGKNMIVTTVGIGSGYDAVVIVDLEGKRLAVYDPRQGNKLKLCAVRNITWDLKMYDYINPSSKGDPTVEEVKKAAKKAEEEENKQPK